MPRQSAIWKCLLLVCALSTQAKASIPAVIASSTAPYSTSSSYGYVNKVVVDGSGNIFVTDSSVGALWEIPVGTTAPVRVTQFVLYASIPTGGGGTGYTSVPTVTFAAPSTPGGVTATGTAVVTAGAVTSIVMTNHGSGYTASPSVTISGGGATTNATATSSIFLSSPHGVATDKAGDVVVSSGSGGNLYFFPNKNGQLCTTCNAAGTEPLDLTGSYGFSSLDDYYVIVADAAFDNSGNLYVAVSHCNNSGSNACGTSEDSIFLLKNITSSTTATTIATAGTATLFIGALPGGKPVLNMTVDNNGHLFYVDGTNAYVVSTTTANAVPTIIGSGYKAPSGIAVDPAGNLYITDNNTKLLYEIPNENGTLNAADQFVVTSLTNPYYSVGFDAVGNIYAADGTDKVINKVTLGALNFPATPVGTPSAAGTVNFRFSTAVTPTSISLLQGNGSSGEFSSTSATTCKVNTAYAAGAGCTVVAMFMPSSTGVREGAIVLGTSTSKAISTAYLSGTGTGPALTIDPGTQTSLTAQSAWQAPAAVAFDAAGNSYTADSGSNVVQVISSAGVAAATIGSGLTRPAGVAVDGAGNVYIADTGANRIVEVPNESGTLNTADQAVLVPSTAGLSAPTGIAVDQAGALYVADTGNARVLRFGTADGLNSLVQTTVGSGFTRPVGLATDGNGNIYVSDTTANQVSMVNLVTSAQTIAAANLSAPTSISVDGSGSLYIVNSSGGSVVRIPNVSGALNPNQQVSLGNNLITPTAVASNGTGNVLIADSGLPGVYALQRTAGAVNFGAVNITLSSTPQTINLTSAGSAALTLGATAYTASGNTADFSVTSPSGTGCSNNEVLSAGSTCSYSATFSPVVPSGTLSETLTFASNAVNAAALTATLTGNATNLSLTTTTLSQVTPANNANPVYGQTITVSATVTSQRAGVVPTGTVTFFVDGTKQKTPVALSTTAPYTATFTVPTLLGAGSHAINASYNGDANNASSAATSALQLLVIQQASTATLRVNYTVPQAPGTSFIFNVSVAATTTGTPSGTVNLVLAGTQTVLGTATLVKGAATISYVPAASGSYQVIYPGDANFSGTTSNSVSVVIEPPNFSVSLSGSSFTVKAGQSFTIPITVTGISGYGGNVTLGGINLTTQAVTSPCTGLPSYVTCTFSPGNVSFAACATPPTASCAVYTPTSDPTLTINLTVATSVPPATPYPLGSEILLWPGGLAGLAALAITLRRRKSILRASVMTVLLCMLLGGLALVTGCGNGLTTFSTPTGTSTVTLTLSGSPAAGAVSPANPDLVSTAAFQLTVQ